jgi:hypothetical protein
VSNDYWHKIYERFYSYDASFRANRINTSGYVYRVMPFRASYANFNYVKNSALSVDERSEINRECVSSTANFLIENKNKIKFNCETYPERKVELKNLCRVDFFIHLL